MLTDDGVAKSRTIIEERSRLATDPSEGGGTVEPSPLPHWDGETRELRLDGQIVKQFKWQAVNQEIVLGAFQEDGWPPVIDDPIPPKPEQDTKRRLQDTIKSLNRNQAHPVIKFHGNGSGEGIRWEIVER